MKGSDFKKIFATDVLSKRERVERTLNLEPVDRAPIQDKISWNPGVVSMYTGSRSKDLPTLPRTSARLSGRLLTRPRAHR